MSQSNPVKHFIWLSTQHISVIRSKENSVIKILTQLIVPLDLYVNEVPLLIRVLIVKLFAVIGSVFSDIKQTIYWLPNIDICNAFFYLLGSRTCMCLNVWFGIHSTHWPWSPCEASEMLMASWLLKELTPIMPEWAPEPVSEGNWLWLRGTLYSASVRSAARFKMISWPIQRTERERKVLKWCTSASHWVLIQDITLHERKR